MMNVANMLPLISPEIKEALEVRNLKRIELTPPVSGLMVYSFLMSKNVTYDEIAGKNVITSKRAPPNATGQYVVGGYYNNSFNEKLVNAVEYSLTRKANADEIVRALLSIASSWDEQKLRQFDEMMNGRLLSKVVPFTMEARSVNMIKAKFDQWVPPKIASRWAAQLDCGNPRVGSVMKVVPPLAYLNGSFEPDQLDARDEVEFFGAAGFAHIRAVEVYFEPTLYDLHGQDVTEEDRKVGKYKVNSADFYAHTPKMEVLISDVYDKSHHAYNSRSSDPGMHKMVSHLLKGEMYTHSDGTRTFGRPFQYKKIMVKGRLATEDVIHLYKDTYKFIICCTGKLTSEEVYFVKYFEDDVESADHSMQESYDEVTKDFVGQYLANNVKVYCKYITCEEEFLSFCMKMYQVRVAVCHAMICQVPILNMCKIIQLGFF